MGLGIHKSANFLSLAHEDKMFKEGALGDDEPEKLLCTVIYMLGMHLALRGEVKHGRFTNHSLRVTSASRIYHKEIPEQVIKEITGHRSDCVRVYKKTSDGILKKASSTISGDFEAKEEKFEADSHGEVEQQNEKNVDSDRLKQSLSVCQMIRNVIKTRIEIRKRKGKLGIKKMAQKILQKKRKIVSKMVKKAKRNRFVIDLNVNVKCNK